MNRPHLLTAITAVLFCLAPLAWSQPDQSSGAATEPAPYRMTTPPGMQTIQVGLYTGVCPQAYVSAVQNGLESVKEPKRPTTMPSDLVANLAAVHDKLATEMTNDLALSDPTVATTFLDTTVTDGLKRLAGITLKMYVLVGTQDEVRSAMLGGWNAPDNFHYNPDSNSVDYSDHAAFPVDRAPDDIVFWVQIDPAMTPADISELVAQRVQKFSDSITAALSQAGPQYTLRLMMNFVNNPNTKDTSADKQNMAWMHLPPSAEWFGLGVMGDLGAK
ncbi:MAG TPA: hypothetical protein VMU31_06790, partial [Rhizomicrobium sp.]|nr:hypothetical protein [Rhizomicrobium sp.]